MFTKDIGIDLGTANTLVYLRGKGIIIREPSVVAVNTHTDRAKYVGKEAKEVIGRTPGSIVAVRPPKTVSLLTLKPQQFYCRNSSVKQCAEKCFQKLV